MFIWICFNLKLYISILILSFNLGHSGSMTNDGDGQGHYVFDMKCSQSKTWFRTNDNKDPVPISHDNVTKKAVVIL